MKLTKEINVLLYRSIWNTVHLGRKLPYERSLSNFLRPSLEGSTSTPVKVLCCSFIYICVLVVALFIFVHLYAPHNWFLAPSRHLVSAYSMHESVLVHLKWVLAYWNYILKLNFKNSLIMKIKETFIIKELTGPLIVGLPWKKMMYWKSFLNFLLLYCCQNIKMDIQLILLLFLLCWPLICYLQIMLSSNLGKSLLGKLGS